MSLVRTLGVSKVRKSFRKGWDSILCSQKGKSQLPHKDFCPINLNREGFEYKSEEFHLILIIVGLNVRLEMGYG